MSKLKTGLIIIIIIVVSVIGMKFFAGKREKPKTKKIPEIKRFVKAKRVKYSTINSKIEANGRLSSLHRLNIITEVQGKILKGSTIFKKGTSFKKGEILFKIFNSEAVLNHKARVSRFLNAVAVLLPDIKIDFPDRFGDWQFFFNNINFDNNLPKLPKILSPKEKVFLASKNILGEYYQIKAEEIRLEKYTIKAPFNGTIISVNLETGSIANPGAIVAVIGRTDELELEIPVSLTFLKWLKRGDKVKVLIDNNTETEGTISRVSDIIDRTTQSLTVFVNIKNNKEFPLYSGMYLKAVFNSVIFENSMEIPRNSVFNGNKVFIVKNNRLKKRTVEIIKINTDTVIFSGLKEGDTIVTESLVNAKENSLVQIIR